MGKHSLRRNRSRSVTAAVLAGGIVASTAPLLPSAHADDVDALIEQMESASHDATAKAEEIKGLEDQIADSEDKERSAIASATEAKAQLEAIRGDSDVQRKNVGDIAQSRYRVPAADALLTTLSSGTPQDAIDRSAYFAALNRNSQRALTELDDANRAAADRANAANIAVAEAQYVRNELDGKRKKLQQERAELDQRVADIERQVDSLNEADRERWVKKDNPVESSALPAVDSGIVAAAMAQLGKPYGWGAAGPDAFDCSGLMMWAYAQNGISIPRTSQAQLAGGTPVSLDALQPGDIIGYYPGVTHVGMYIGDGMVVHSSDYGIPIQVVPLNSMPVQGAVRY